MFESLSDTITVTGTAVNGKEAVAMAEEQCPDIVFMDVRMPVLDGVKAVQILRQKQPEIKVVMLSTFPDDFYVREAIHYGAWGYILKDMSAEDIIASVEAVYRGAALFSPEILERLVDRENRKGGYEEIVSCLGKREREVFDLVVKGMSNQAIADTLFISEPTVRNYVSSIYAKVGTNDRTRVLTLGQKENVKSE
jgi:DNA-binding NarL/FixJ family response regulator